VVVAFKPKRLLLGVKGAAPVIDAELPKRVKTDDCYWTLG
jgi:hypothetical protein